MRPPNVRACVEVSHRLTLEGHYGGVLIFLSSSVRAFVELVVCLAFPFMTSSVRLSFAAAHFSCGRISCSQSDQSGKPFFLQAKKHPLGSLTYHEQCGGALPKTTRLNERRGAMRRGPPRQEGTYIGNLRSKS